MKPQGLPPHYESPNMQKMHLHPDGSTAEGHTEITSHEHPAYCMSAFLRKNSLFWEISSFWELGRLLLNSLCHGTAGIDPAHVCDCGRPLPSPWVTDIPGWQWGFSPRGSSSSQPQAQTLPQPRATQEELPLPHLLVWVDKTTFFFASSCSFSLVP